MVLGHRSRYALTWRQCRLEANATLPSQATGASTARLSISRNAVKAQRSRVTRKLGSHRAGRRSSRSRGRARSTPTIDPGADVTLKRITRPHAPQVRCRNTGEQVQAAPATTRPARRRAPQRDRGRGQLLPCLGDRCQERSTRARRGDHRRRCGPRVVESTVALALTTGATSDEIVATLESVTPVTGAARRRAGPSHSRRRVPGRLGRRSSS